MNIIPQVLPPSQRPVPHSFAVEVNGRHDRLKAEHRELRREGYELHGFEITDGVMDHGIYPRVWPGYWNENHSLKTTIWLRALSSNAQAIRENAALIRSLQ